MASRPPGKVRDFVVLIATAVMAIFCGIMAAAALLSQRVLADAANGDSMNAAPGQSGFTAPAGYPTTAFSSYYPVPSDNSLSPPSTIQSSTSPSRVISPTRTPFLIMIRIPSTSQGRSRTSPCPSRKP